MSDSFTKSPPQSTTELMTRANHLSGLNLGQLAQLCGKDCPLSLRHAKGWLGQTLELYLGASANSLALPDFVKLGIELKTLPLDANGKPLETTYVTYAPIPFQETQWRQSTVFHKMQHVLWFPYLGEGPIAHRQLATPFLWQMDAHWSLQLEHDWLELTEKLRLYAFDEIHAGLGQYLQLRPKAADSRSFIEVLGQEGEPIKVVPKGFYLRDSFTRQLLQDFFSV